MQIDKVSFIRRLEGDFVLPRELSRVFRKVRILCEPEAATRQQIHSLPEMPHANYQIKILVLAKSEVTIDRDRYCRSLVRQNRDVVCFKQRGQVDQVAR